MEPAFTIELSRRPTFENLPIDDVAKALSSPPFVALKGSLNFRDLGGSPLTSAYIKPGKVFRSGEGYIGPEDTERLHLVKVFDLRSERERKLDTIPWTGHEGCEVVWTPADTEVLTTPSSGSEADDIYGSFPGVYRRILQTHRTAYAALFRAIASLQSDQAVLFHCSAGKDRTGVAAALILSLLGAPKDVIGVEYALTRVGVEPAKDMLLEALKRGMPGVPMDDPKFVAACQFKPEAMVEFLDKVEEKWGDVEGFCKEILGLSAEEISQVRQNLQA